LVCWGIGPDFTGLTVGLGAVLGGFGPFAIVEHSSLTSTSAGRPQAGGQDDPGSPHRWIECPTFPTRLVDNAGQRGDSLLRADVSTRAQPIRSGAGVKSRYVTSGGDMADSDAPRILGRTEPCKGPQARPGPKGHPPEHYERVAAAYRQALISHPRSPMRALAEQLHASDATVRRWVQRARDKGLLGPSVPGKAGETAT
jgi:hypothetical protein